MLWSHLQEDSLILGKWQWTLFSQEVPGLYGGLLCYYGPFYNKTLYLQQMVKVLFPQQMIRQMVGEGDVMAPSTRRLFNGVIVLLCFLQQNSLVKECPNQWLNAAQNTLAKAEHAWTGYFQIHHRIINVLSQKTLQHISEERTYLDQNHH